MSDPGDNLRRLTGLYRTIVRIRAFEGPALEAHKAGEFPGCCMFRSGRRRSRRASALNMRDDEPHHVKPSRAWPRDRQGADPKRMMAELYGRASGYCRGKGGSMHIADFSVGMLGANGVVAGGIPIAVGAAQRMKMQKSDAIVTCMFGDGAVNRGPFLEGLNWAVLFKLPVLFVCEDNGVAAFTRAESVTAGPGVIDRAKALGVAAITIDGNNAMAWMRNPRRSAAVRAEGPLFARARRIAHRPPAERRRAAAAGSRGGALARSDRAGRPMLAERAGTDALGK